MTTSHPDLPFNAVTARTFTASISSHARKVVWERSTTRTPLTHLDLYPHAREVCEHIQNSREQQKAPEHKGQRKAFCKHADNRKQPHGDQDKRHQDDNPRRDQQRAQAFSAERMQDRAEVLGASRAFLRHRRDQSVEGDVA
jgi:hypothetical protein